MSKKIALAAVLIFLAAGCGQIAAVQTQTKIKAPQNDQPTQNVAPVATSSPPQISVKVYSIGNVSRHPKNYLGQKIQLAGFLLKKQAGYAIFSDEPSGALGVYDLPVTGGGIESLKFNQKYLLLGILVYQGLQASNHNDYHLELLALPKITSNP